MYTVDWDGTTYSNEMVPFYGVDGQRMGSYRVNADPGGAPYYQASIALVLDEERVFFAGRLVATTKADGWGGYNVTYVQQDRLGSVESYYPYGEARGGGSMFATYTRDAGGLDYAVNRYYSSGLGRFTSPDPFGGSGTVGNPGSWNRYGYVGGDPVNKYDPAGLVDTVPSGGGAPSGPQIGYQQSAMATNRCLASLMSQLNDMWNSIGHNGYANPGFYAGFGAAQNGCRNYAQSMGVSGGGRPSVSDAVMRDRWYEGMARAVRALQTNRDCAGLFGLTGPLGNTSPDPLTVLSQIGNSVEFGTIASASNTVTSATVTGQGSGMVSIGNGATILTNTNVVIRLNNLSTGATFVDGGVGDWAGTILHELGHAFWDLYGPGTSLILPDGPSAPPGVDGVKASEANTALVKKQCDL